MDFDFTTETITPDTTDILTIGGVGGLEIPSGTTAQRPGNPANGLLRYNTDSGQVEIYYSNIWASSVSSIANQVIVQKNPGANEFSSIAAGVSSITGASAITPTTVIVYPGTYTEPEITLPEYVQITGLTEYGITVQPLTSSQNLFNMAVGTSINFLSIRDVGAGFAGIVAADVGNYALCHKVSMVNCDIGWNVYSTTEDSVMYLEYCDTAGGTTGVSITSSNGKTISTNLENFYIYGLTTNPTNGLYISGVDTRVTMQAFGLEGIDGTGNGAFIQDGAILVVKAGHIFGWDIGSNVFSSGAAPDVQYLGCEFNDNTTWDFLTTHIGCTGVLSGTVRKEFVNADASPNFTFAFSDALENNYVQTGSFFVGSEPSKLTDVTSLIIDTAPMGLLSGGELSVVSGLTVNISAGSGYLINASDVVTKISWPSTDILLPAESSPYIYVNTSGVLTYAVSPPSELSNIILSRVLTGTTDIITSGASSFNIMHYGNGIDAFLKEAIGPVYRSGSIVTENASINRSLDVTAGNWYFSTDNVLPSAGTGIVFLDVYEISGNIALAPLTQVDNTTYLSGGDLVPMTPDWYAKFTLYSSGEGATQMFFMQHASQQYETLQEAVDAPLPAPLIDPAGVPYIAAIIVQEGNDNIVQIIDIRPKIFGTSGTGVAGVSDHGELTGLLDDDHPQYLLVNGTRSMIGSLNMASNTITNAGTINGVTIQAHGGRHGANSADPIPTAAPIASLSSSSTNSIGIADALSRSDHSHAITGFQPLDATLTSLSTYNTNGILTQTATDTFTGRTLTGTASRISISNGNGVSGNPTVNIDATYVGQNSITTLGTISSGIWNGTTIDIANGGTGQTTSAAAINALVPDQTGNSGKVLTTNGSIVSWGSTTTGTVTSVSVVTANGFSGSVATATSAPAITLSTTITGILKGNGSAISAASAGTDYTVGTSGLATGILKSTTTTGTLSIAAPGDFPTLNQNTTGTASNVTGIVAIANGGTNLNSIGTSNQLLGVNTAGTALEYKTFIAGSGISVINAANSITIGNTGVTSVSASGTQGVSISGSPVTTTGTITIGLGAITPTSVAASGTVTGSNLSGTNTGDQTITLTGDITGSGTGTFATTLATVNSDIGSFGSNTSIPIITVNAKGLITAISTVASVGTVSSVAVSGGTTGLTTSGGPVTTSGTITISGTLAIANGGTGQTTASSAFNVLSPITTLGDIIYGSGVNTAARLAGNITNTRQFLRQLGNGSISAAPAWDTVTKTDVGLSNVENTALSTWPGTVNIITTGTLTTGTWAASTIAANKGGTGQTTYTVGDILYADTTSTLTKLSDIATGNALISGGINAAPSWNKIGLTTHVTGTLPIANGGTNLTSFGTANQILGVNSGASALEYKTVTAGNGITIVNSTNSITISSKLLQTVTGSIAATTGTTQVPYDNTAPTNTEGFQIWSQAFTPLSALSTIIITYTITTAQSTAASRNIIASVFNGATNLQSVMINVNAVSVANLPAILTQTVSFQPGSTAAITLSCRIGANGTGTTYVNQTTAATLGGAAVTDYTIMEVL